LKKDKHPDVDSFDGIILGTSVYAGTPSKAMQHFCKENLETLKQKRLALFVCGMEPDSAKQQQELANAYRTNMPYPSALSAASSCLRK
jgi:menaquinone-dependent protoporphyrinogen oxidase